MVGPNTPASAALLLERLIMACTDGMEGYRHAAKAVHFPETHEVLEQNRADREEMASALAYALVELGRSPDPRGSVRGAFHRAWLDAISAVRRSKSEGAVLRECTRGERETMRVFSDALALDLPPAVRSVIQSQLGRLVVAGERLAHARELYEERAALATAVAAGNRHVSRGGVSKPAHTDE